MEKSEEKKIDMSWLGKQGVQYLNTFCVYINLYELCYNHILHEKQRVKCIS